MEDCLCIYKEYLGNMPKSKLSIRDVPMENSDSVKTFSEHFSLPEDTIFLYARFWQLETWLRQMVYIELRSAEKDWESYLPKPKEPNPREKDKRLTHMVTSQESMLAYITFGELWRIIQDNALWGYFSVYFPPKDILEVKLKELSQIRHRVAHFRVPHKDDLRRAEQFLRDIDQSFWKLCTSYNNTRWFYDPQKNALSEKLVKLPTHAVTVQIGRSIRPWVDVGKIDRPFISAPGLLYHAVIVVSNFRNYLRYGDILKFTKSCHKHCIHVKLDRLCHTIELSFPSILDHSIIEDTIKEFHEAASTAALPVPQDDKEAERIASEWPEYVLPPSDPLSFLTPDMPCTFFGV